VIQETLRVMSSKGKAAKKRALEKKEEAATAAKEKAEVEVSAEKNEPKLKPGEFGHPVPVVPLEKSALKPAERVGLIEGISADMKTEGLRKRKIGDFGGDISEMMFGFGDSWPPNTDAVRTVDNLVTEFIQDLGARALRVAEMRPDKRLDKECFLYLVRKDRKKFQRVHCLLAANAEIKKHKKLDIQEEAQP
jgi:hypothetical protein